jgi:hypothetical protein
MPALPENRKPIGGARQMCRASLFFLPAIYDLILKNIVDENKTIATEFKI